MWCSRRAGETLEWLPGGRVEDAPTGWTRSPARPTTRAWWPRWRPTRTPTPAALFGGERPLLVALDEVTDPHNLGAVARVAECAGADGLMITRRRSAAVTAAACRASAGAVEHLPIAQVENLADTLLRARRPGLWSYGAAADGETRYDRRRLPRGGTVFVLGAEGARAAPAGAQGLRHHGRRSRCAAASTR